MRYQDLLENELIKKIPNLKNVQFLNNVFKKEGYELRLVGGVVRDLLQNKTPKDVDLATNATPSEMLEIAKKYDIPIVPTGEKHGTMTFIVNFDPYEITTLRIDKNTDGRHAEVEFTKNWEEDAKRRDLTFNAMSMDLDGNIYDYHQGQEDLKTGKAKFVGDADSRIKEDFLRILRYFRFQGKLPNTSWDKETLEAIKNNAENLNSISGERIWAEVYKILLGPNVKEVLEKMDETGVSKHINLFFNYGKNFLETILKNSEDPIIGLAYILPNIEEGKKLNSRYKLSAEDRELLLWLINKKENDYSLREALFNIIIKNDKKSFWLKYFLLKNKLNSYQKLKDFEIPVFPIKGDDLIKKGLKPGPELGKKLNELKIKWFDSNFKLSKEDLLKESLQENIKTVDTDIVSYKKEKITKPLYFPYYEKTFKPEDPFEIVYFEDVLGDKVLFNFTNSNYLILPKNSVKLGEIFNTKVTPSKKYKIPEKLDKLINSTFKKY